MEDRNIENLLKSSEMLSGNLYLAGPVDEKYFNRLQNVYEETYQKKWFYKGFLDREGVEKLYSICAAGVCTYKKTINNFYAYPTKIFEYMRAGLPIVVSDFPLWREIIQESQCGFCVNEEVPSEICAKLNYLLKHSDEAKQMGENGRKAVLTKYNWNAEEKKLLQTYSNLL